jgi:GMP synthase (glutamine-hydrolysing)
MAGNRSRVAGRNVKIKCMGNILVLQHAECESLGAIEQAIASRGLRAEYIRTFAGESVPGSIGDACALIVMGGPMSVYEKDRYPFLADELRLIRQGIAAGRAVLGVCLGSQLLAEALGGVVGKGRGKELGWHEVSLDDQAENDPLLDGLPRRFMGFHWHGDVFTLPPGAVPLASSGLTDCQAFRYANKAYGFLFHLEVTPDLLRGMVRNFEEELREAALDGARIEADAERYLAPLSAIGGRVFERWTAFI